MKLWTIITVTYNSSKTLETFWTNKLPDNVDWIVVDNASNDNSAEIAQKLGATVIKLGANTGFSVANNIGLASASTEMIAFVNPDVTVNYSSLRSFEETLSGHDCLISPQLRNFDGSLQPNGRGLPTIWAKINNRRRPESCGIGSYLFPTESAKIFVCWTMGAVVCGSRSTFKKLSGWNESFFLYYEDADLGLRAWKLGIPTIVDGSVQWTHGWARETSEFRIQPWIYELRAAAIFYKKHAGLLLRAPQRLASYRKIHALCGITPPPFSANLRSI